MNDEANIDSSCTISHVFEKYGMTMYRAQILESDLQMIVSCLGKLGVVEIDRVQSKVTEDNYGVTTACIGPMVHWMKNTTTVAFPDALVKQLKKANMQRNLLAHTFLYQHSEEMLTGNGRKMILNKLQRILAHLDNVGKSVAGIRNFLYAEYGFTEEIMDRIVSERLDELRQMDRPNDN